MCASQEEAWEQAVQEAGWPANAVPSRLPNLPLRPGSQSPFGPPGFHESWEGIYEDEAGELQVHPNTIHLDPYGHYFADNGTVIPPHYGVNPSGGTQTSMHFAWPSSHDPRTNR